MEIRAGVFRVDPARTKWGREGDGGRGREGGGRWWIDSVVFIAPYF